MGVVYNVFTVKSDSKEAEAMKEQSRAYSAVA